MIIAVDFDGTIVEHQYPKIGPEVPGAIGTLKWLIKRGHHVFLWSARDAASLIEAIRWLEERDVWMKTIHYYPGATDKALADVYIDDRALGCPLLENGSVDWNTTKFLLEGRGA